MTTKRQSPEDEFSVVHRFMVDLMKLRHRAAKLNLYGTRDCLTTTLKQFVDDTRP